MRGSSAIQTLIVLTIPIFGSAYPPCDGLVKEFRGLHDRKECACTNETSDYYYYRCKLSGDSCFRCLFESDTTIPAEAVCDSVIDCPDLTDELLCDHVDFTALSGCDRIDQSMIEESNTGRFNGTMHCVCRIYESGQFFLAYNTDVNATTIARHNGDIETSLMPVCDCFNSEDEDSTSLSCFNMSKEKARYTYSNVKTPQIAFGFMIGIVAIVGNTAAIFMTVKNIYKKHTRMTREERITKYLFLSLSFSDMAVATCTIFFCIHLQFLKSTVHMEKDNYWEISYCSTNGALALIGSEQSIFTMVLISMSRIWGVARPFSRTPIKAFVILLFVAWLLSILIGIIPLMEVFEDSFLKDILQNEARLLPIILQDDVDDVRSFLRQYSNTSDSSRPSSSLRDLQYLMDELFGIKKLYYVGYYQGLFSCLPDIYPRRDSLSIIQFNFAVFSLNIFCFIFMLVGYGYIYAKQGRGRKMITAVPADAETQKLKRKIFYILATDFFCWMPVCIFGVVHIIHSSIQTDSCHLSKSAHRTLSLIAILVVVPLNSAVNPFIYSAAPEYLRRNLIAFSSRVKRKLSSKSDT